MPESRPALDAQALAAIAHEDWPAALAQVRAHAHAGDVEAQALLGQLYAEGRGVERDEREALHWWSLAANSGHAGAANMLGRCHELGRGTSVDLERAAAWYRTSASAGFDWGLYNYANLLATGRGVAQDGAAAFALYRRAAGMGHAKSMNLVGRYYEEGTHVERDPLAAFDWYRRSAEAGDFRGQASCAAVLAQRGEIDAAAAWLRGAAETGTPAFLSKLAGELADSPHEILRDIGAACTWRAREVSRSV